MPDKLLTLRFKTWDTWEIIEIKVFHWYPTKDGVVYRKSTQTISERSFMPNSKAYFWEVC